MFPGFPSLMAEILLAPILIAVIQEYNQWAPALVPLIFICINFAFAAAATQLTNLLNAVGKIKITFYLMIMWTALTWLFIPYLSIKFGVTGAAIGHSLVGLHQSLLSQLPKSILIFPLPKPYSSHCSEPLLWGP
jgi:O-antigen/teichoic acid export membrane protein